MKKWELITCMLLHFRDRMNLKAPIYFSTGLTEKVLYSEMELMDYKLVLFDQLGLVMIVRWL